jgi:hypothetical protein
LIIFLQTSEALPLYIDIATGEKEGFMSELSASKGAIKWLVLCAFKVNYAKI